MDIRRRVLLTGGGGMVGSNILDHPKAIEWEFLAPSRRELDLTDFEATRRFFAKARPEIVIHAAGRVGGIQANVAQPVNFLVANLDIGRNAILAAREAGVRKLINLGSSCMYPRNAPNPLREEAILTGELEPTNEGYALAKIAVMRLCEYIHREDRRCEYRTLIPCNLYGRYDKFSPTDSHLIPAIIHKIYIAKSTGRETVDIWGNGTARREFMYAGDFADAVICALEEFASLPSVMNIGLGYDYSINEYYRAAAEVIGWEGNFAYDLSKPVGMRQKLVSNARQAKWGWQASTNLRDGIAATYEYYLRKHQ